MTRVRVLLGVAALAAMGFPAAGEIIVNGDFATGDYSGWDWEPDPEGGSYMAPTVVSFMDKNMFRVNAGPESLHIGEEIGGTLGQEIDLESGVTYRLSGFLVIQNAVDYGVGEAGSIEVELGGSEVWHMEQEEIGAGEVLAEPFSLEYTPAGTGPIDIELHFGRPQINQDETTGQPLIQYYVTDFSMEAIPAPSSGLALGGLALLGARRRR